MSPTPQAASDALEKARCEFEKWITADGDYPHLKHKNFGGNYLHEETAMKWDGFKEGYRFALLTAAAQPATDTAGEGDLEAALKQLSQLCDLTYNTLHDFKEMHPEWKGTGNCFSAKGALVGEISRGIHRTGAIKTLKAALLSKPAAGTDELESYKKLVSEDDYSMCVISKDDLEKLKSNQSAGEWQSADSVPKDMRPFWGRQKLNSDFYEVELVQFNPCLGRVVWYKSGDGQRYPLHDWKPLEKPACGSPGFTAPPPNDERGAP